MIPQNRAPAPWSSWIALVLRIVVGGVLMYAGFSKAMGPSAEFAGAIDAYRILPAHWVTPLATGLPWVEMWVGLFLIAGFYTPQAALLATGLFTMFVCALASSMIRGIDLASCGCFGAESLSPHQTIGMDIALLAISIWLATRKTQSQLLSFENL